MATEQQQRYYRGEVEHFSPQDTFLIVQALEAERGMLHRILKAHLKRQNAKRIAADDEEESDVIRYPSFVDKGGLHISWTIRTKTAGMSIVEGDLTVNVHFNGEHRSQGTRIHLRFDGARHEWSCRVVPVLGCGQHHILAREYLKRFPALNSFPSDEEFIPFSWIRIRETDVEAMVWAFEVLLMRPEPTNGKKSRR